MIFRLLPFLKYLVVPEDDASPRRWLIWRLSVAGTALMALFVGLCGLGWIPAVDGFAYAEDIDDKIEAALEPVNTRLTSIEDSQDVQGGYLMRLVKSDIAQDIHAEKTAWCRADDDHEKQRLREKLDELQYEYEKVAGEGKSATEPDCA